MRPTLSDTEVAQIDAYWRATNYLSVAQIYLQGNPLLKEPLTVDHIKPRLLGHFGMVPGLNLIYVHLKWLEGYLLLLTGRHGLLPCYEAFATIVDSMVNQLRVQLEDMPEITNWKWTN